MRYTKNTKNNFMCPHDVYEDLKFLNMPLSAQILYTHLCRLANRLSDDDGWFYRSLAKLVIDTGMSSKSISNAKKTLIDKQFIDVKRGYYKHTKLRTYDYFRLNGYRFKV